MNVISSSSSVSNSVSKVSNTTSVIDFMLLTIVELYPTSLISSSLTDKRTITFTFVFIMSLILISALDDSSSIIVFSNSKAI